MPELGKNISESGGVHRPCGPLDGPYKDIPIQDWPANARVCKCRRVTRGELSAAIERGSRSAASVRRATRAATGCGGCQPLIDQLLSASPSSCSAYFRLKAVCAVSLLALGALWVTADLAEVSISITALRRAIQHLAAIF